MGPRRERQSRGHVETSGSSPWLVRAGEKGRGRAEDNRLESQEGIPVGLWLWGHAVSDRAVGAKKEASTARGGCGWAKRSRKPRTRRHYLEGENSRCLSLAVLGARRMRRSRGRVERSVHCPRGRGDTPKPTDGPRPEARSLESQPDPRKVASSLCRLRSELRGPITRGGCL